MTMCNDTYHHATTLNSQSVSGNTRQLTYYQDL